MQDMIKCTVLNDVESTVLDIIYASVLVMTFR